MKMYCFLSEKVSTLKEKNSGANSLLLKCPFLDWRAGKQTDSHKSYLP